MRSERCSRQIARSVALVHSLEVPVSKADTGHTSSPETLAIAVFFSHEWLVKVWTGAVLVAGHAAVLPVQAAAGAVVRGWGGGAGRGRVGGRHRPPHGGGLAPRLCHGGRLACGLLTQ